MKFYINRASQLVIVDDFYFISIADIELELGDSFSNVFGNDYAIIEQFNTTIPTVYSRTVLPPSGNGTKTINGGILGTIAQGAFISLIANTNILNTTIDDTIDSDNINIALDAKSMVLAQKSFRDIGKKYGGLTTPEILIYQENFDINQGIFTFNNAILRLNVGVNNTKGVKIKTVVGEFSGLLVTVVGFVENKNYTIRMQVKNNTNQDFVIHANTDSNSFVSTILTGTAGWQEVSLVFNTVAGENSASFTAGIDNPTVADKKAFVDSVALYGDSASLSNREESDVGVNCAIANIPLGFVLTTEDTLNPEYACIVAIVYNLEQTEFNGGANIIDCTRINNFLER